MGWSARDNYGKKKRRKKEKPIQQDQNNTNKKCRAIYGLDAQNLWCQPCRRKKKCIRFMDEEERLAFFNGNPALAAANAARYGLLGASSNPLMFNQNPSFLSAQNYFQNLANNQQLQAQQQILLRQQQMARLQQGLAHQSSMQQQSNTSSSSSASGTPQHQREAPLNHQLPQSDTTPHRTPKRENINNTFVKLEKTPEQDLDTTLTPNNNHNNNHNNFNPNNNNNSLRTNPEKFTNPDLNFTNQPLPNSGPMQIGGITSDSSEKSINSTNSINNHIVYPLNSKNSSNNNNPPVTSYINQPINRILAKTESGVSSNSPLSNHSEELAANLTAQALKLKEEAELAQAKAEAANAMAINAQKIALEFGSPQKNIPATRLFN